MQGTWLSKSVVCIMDCLYGIITVAIPIAKVMWRAKFQTPLALKSVKRFQWNLSWIYNCVSDMTTDANPQHAVAPFTLPLVKSLNLYKFKMPPRCHFENICITLISAMVQLITTKFCQGDQWPLKFQIFKKSKMWMVTILKVIKSRNGASICSNELFCSVRRLHLRFYVIKPQNSNKKNKTGFNSSLL